MTQNFLDKGWRMSLTKHVFAVVSLVLSFSFSTFADGTPDKTPNPPPKGTCAYLLLKIAERPLPQISEVAWQKVMREALMMVTKGSISIEDFQNPKISVATSRFTYKSVLILETSKEGAYFFTMDGERRYNPNTNWLPSWNAIDQLVLNDGRILDVDMDGGYDGESPLWTFRKVSPDAVKAVWRPFGIVKLPGMSYEAWEKIGVKAKELLLQYSDDENWILPSDLEDPKILKVTSLKTNKTIWMWEANRTTLFFSLEGDYLRNPSTRSRLHSWLWIGDDELLVEDGRVIETNLYDDEADEWWSFKGNIREALAAKWPVNSELKTRLGVSNQAWEKIGLQARQLLFNRQIKLSDFEKPEIQFATDSKTNITNINLLLLIAGERVYIFSMEGKPIERLVPVFDIQGSDYTLHLGDGRTLNVQLKGDETEYWNLSK